MGENSKIEWTDHTFNPWMGCSKVSPACQHCYAERDMDHRWGKVKWGPSGTRVVTSDANWRQPLKWDRAAEKDGVRKRVFCASLADVFEDWQGKIESSQGFELARCHGCGKTVLFTENCGGGDPQCSRLPRALTMDDLRRDLFDLIRETPNLDWLLLTKRPENVAAMLPGDWGAGYHNVWLGTSVESQEWADERIPRLLAVPAVVRFLSCEPLLGVVDLYRFLEPIDADECINCGFQGETLIDDRKFTRSDCGDLLCRECGHSSGCTGRDGIHWVIVGGESGPHARPSHPDWFRSLRDQCQAAGVPFHFKQHGEWMAHSQAMQTPEFPVAETEWGYNLGDDDDMARVGKYAAGRLLDGREWNEFPTTLIHAS